MAEKTGICSGVLLVDKPAGMTSHDVVSQIRRLYGIKKAGHTGTLDPAATGLLVVLLGTATKAAEYIPSDDKKYEAGLTLGIETDTQDITGRILARSNVMPSEKEVIDAVSGFSGEQEQIPPMFSALKVNGRKLYEIARKGEEVERRPRTITVYSISAARITDSEYSLSVHCSKGTYIRTICSDIGGKLGTGAVMSSLRRTGCGSFSINDALTLDVIKDMTQEEKCRQLIPVEDLFRDLPAVELPDFYERLCRCGAEIYCSRIGCSLGAGEKVRILGRNGFFALGEVREYEEGLAVKNIKNFDTESSTCSEQ